MQKIEEKKGLNERDLECQICLSLICEPVTIPCGHSFCRLCLVRATRRAAQCVVCRAACHISAEDASENVMIKNIARCWDPALYDSRRAELDAERKHWQLQHPVFSHYSVMFPGEILKLHLFEPRYKEMMRRVTSGSNCFTYVCVRNSCVGSSIGAIALIATVTQAHFTADGRCFLKAALQFPRYKITEVNEDGSTAGLYYARMEEYHDEPMRLPGSSHWNNVAERPSRESISEIIGEGEAESREVVAEETINVQALVTECRMLIDGEESFSLHMMSRIDDSLLDGVDNMYYLSSTDTVKRLKAGVDVLHEMHRQHINQTTNEGIFRSAISNLSYAVRRLRHGSDAVAGHSTVADNLGLDEEPEGSIIEPVVRNEMTGVTDAAPTNDDSDER